MIPDAVAAIPTDSHELARAELRRNPCYAKIPEDRKEWYIEQAYAMGTKAAEEQLERGGVIAARIAEAGVELVRRHERAVAGRTALRSEISFSKEHTTITVYMDSIELICENAKRFARKDLRLTRAQALDMHLAHEFFHYLEFSSGQTVSQRLPRQEIDVLGRFKRRIEINETCEIAAQAFAKRYCGLAVLPTYYDLLYIKTR